MREMCMNTEKILLVDDERAIRLAVRTALTRGDAGDRGF